MYGTSIFDLWTLSLGQGSVQAVTLPSRPLTYLSFGTGTPGHLRPQYDGTRFDPHHCKKPKEDITVGTTINKHIIDQGGRLCLEVSFTLA
jgi:hypothetical protein